jgi:hypothetical protein
VIDTGQVQLRFSGPADVYHSGPEVGGSFEPAAAETSAANIGKSPASASIEMALADRNRPSESVMN